MYTRFIRILFLTTFIAVFYPASSSDHSMPLKAGDKAPDFTLYDSTGKAVSLASLKGKAVLLDFWASWCPYCKILNAELIPVYAKYKALGFEIFSISLDKKKEAWLNAIHTQNLYWPLHASDLLGWESPVAELYRVEVLPTSFLIDEEGIIMAVDPDESDLEKKLNWYYNEQIRFYPHVAAAKIFFTDKTKFQIEDASGKVLLKGKDQEVDITGLAAGEYVVRYGDKTEKFKKPDHGHSIPVTFYPERVEDKITLSREADFILYSQHGKVMKRGRASIIDVTGFHSGVYYLSIEGNLHPILKK